MIQLQLLLLLQKVSLCSREQISLKSNTLLVEPPTSTLSEVDGQELPPTPIFRPASPLEITTEPSPIQEHATSVEPKSRVY